MKPDGTELSGLTIVNSSNGFIETIALPATGTYTLSLNPMWLFTGQATLALYTVSDITGPITPDGTAVPLTLTTPGQNAPLTFSGTAGQKVSATLTNSTFSCGCNTVRFAILKPDGTELSGLTIVNNGNGFIDTVTLPTTGTYTLSLNPMWLYTGQATVKLYTVVDVTGSLTIGGAAVPISLSTPGQIAQLTFSGTASQLLTVRITSNTISSVTVKLLKPDATVLTSTTSSVASFNLTQQTLPTTGTYTVAVDPPGSNTGGLSVSVTSP